MATNKLYKVTCKGMTTDLSNNHGIGYAIAPNPARAYEMVKSYLEACSFGTSKECELDKIELIAEEIEYPNCGFKLYL